MHCCKHTMTRKFHVTLESESLSGFRHQQTKREYGSTIIRFGEGRKTMGPTDEGKLSRMLPIPCFLHLALAVLPEFVLLHLLPRPPADRRHARIIWDEVGRERDQGR